MRYDAAAMAAQLRDADILVRRVAFDSTTAISRPSTGDFVGNHARDPHIYRIGNKNPNRTEGKLNHKTVRKQEE